MTNNISKAEQILFEEYYTKVFKSVYIYCNDYHFAEDATQEAFLRAFENIDKLRDVNSFAGWVYVIAINIVKKEFKKTKKITQINFIDCENKFTSKDEYSNIELKEVLADLLTQVSLDESKALTLFYIMDLPLKEIARMGDF